MWTVEFLSKQVWSEFSAQPREIRASFERIVGLIQANGLEKVHEPYVKESVLWEMRLKGKDGIARAVYVTAAGRRIVILRVFTKKTEKTPRREIELALQRSKEVR
jgi:phage-related protein